MSDGAVAGRLRAAAEHLEAEGPLREWTEALAEAGEEIVAAMKAAAAEATAAVERRAKALEVAREGAEAAAETARLAVADHKARSDEALAALVESLREEVGSGIKDVLVIKQRIVGAQRIGLVAGLGALAAAGLIGVGAALTAWRNADAVRFHATCARELVFDKEGKAYCPMHSVVEREQAT